MRRLLAEKDIVHSSGFKGKIVLILVIACIPFLAISLIVNLRFLLSQQRSAEHIMDSVTAQTESFIASQYNMASSLAQTLSISPVLQDDILVSHDKTNDWFRINHNILTLRSLINSYLFIGDITGIRFYLPDDMIIPNGSEYIDIADIINEEWFADYKNDSASKQTASHTLYLSSGNGALVYIQPLRNPQNYTEILGYLRIDLSLAVVSEQMVSSLIYDQGGCYLLNNTGRMILSFGQTLSDEAIIKNMRNPLNTAWQNTLEFNHKKYLCTCYPVADSDMILLNLVPSSSIYNVVLKNYLFQVILFAIEIALLITLMSVFAMSVIRSRDNRLRYLNYQINPHFLYNTLDMINWTAIDQGIPEIYRPIQELSKFYKITLNHGKDLITVGEEIEQLRLYLELQNMRFADSIVYSITVDEKMNEKTILHMILQPILENSILHGIRETSTHRGTISITGNINDKGLCFEIRDDGVGMDQGKADMLLHTSTQTGYGLKNIQDRIRLYYGKNYGIRIKSSPGQGTAVFIQLPDLDS